MHRPCNAKIVATLGPASADRATIAALVAAGGGFLSIPFMVFCNIVIHHAVGTSAAPTAVLRALISSLCSTRCSRKGTPRWRSRARASSHSVAQLALTYKVTGYRRCARCRA